MLNVQGTVSAYIHFLGMFLPSDYLFENNGLHKLLVPPVYEIYILYYGLSACMLQAEHLVLLVVFEAIASLWFYPYTFSIVSWCETLIGWMGITSIDFLSLFVFYMLP